MSVDPANALDVPDAVGPLAAMLAREEDGEQAAPAAAPPETAPAQPAEVPAEPQEQETAEAEASDAPAEEAPVDEGEATEEQPGPQKYTVKADGKTHEVTVDDLIRSYQLDAVVTRKSQALSEERKTLEQQSQAVSQERAQYAQLLPALQQRLEASMPQAPDPKLKESNPIDYFVLKGEYDEKTQQLNAIQQERQRLAAVGRQEQETRQQAMMAESHAKLLETIPEWKDEAKRETLKAGLREYAKTLGYSDDEISQTFDHRAIRVLNEGYKARKLLAATPPRPVQTGPRAAAPGSAVRTPARATEITRDKQRLAQTGNVNDAASIFLKMGVENF